MDEVNIKILELRVKNLVSKRQLVVSILVVLIGGLVSLSFMQNGIQKTIFLLSGTFYAFILIKDFIIINEKNDRLLNWKRG